MVIKCIGFLLIFLSCHQQGPIQTVASLLPVVGIKETGYESRRVKPEPLQGLPSSWEDWIESSEVPQRIKDEVLNLWRTQPGVFEPLFTNAPSTESSVWEYPLHDPENDLGGWHAWDEISPFYEPGFYFAFYDFLALYAPPFYENLETLTARDVETGDYFDLGWVSWSRNPLAEGVPDNSPMRKVGFNQEDLNSAYFKLYLRPEHSNKKFLFTATIDGEEYSHLEEFGVFEEKSWRPHRGEDPNIFSDNTLQAADYNSSFPFPRPPNSIAVLYKRVALSSEWRDYTAIPVQVIDFTNVPTNISELELSTNPKALPGTYHVVFPALDQNPINFFYDDLWGVNRIHLH